MRILILICLLAFALPALGEILTVPVNSTNSLVLNVPSNAVLEVLCVFPDHGGSGGIVRGNLSNSVFTTSLPYGNPASFSDPWQWPSMPLVLAGPLQMTFTSLFSSAFVTYRITAQTAADSVIVPAGTSARITVESSRDLLTWSSVVPGPITNAPSNLFFRLRADRL